MVTGHNVIARRSYIISATSRSKMSYIAIPVKPPPCHIVRRASPTGDGYPQKAG
jgi:hypothetical protein